MLGGSALWGSTLPRGGSQGGDPSEGFLSEANCQTTDSAGDLVYITGVALLGKIQVAKVDPYDFDKLPVVGMIILKSSSTVCTVQHGGRINNVLSGLTSNKRYFCGASGTVALTPPPGPNTRLAQVVGIAISSDIFWLEIKTGFILQV